jgi:hypothetical protein
LQNLSAKLEELENFINAIKEVSLGANTPKNSSINQEENTVISTSRKNQGQGLDNSSSFLGKQQQQPNDSMGGSVTPKSSYSQSQSSNNNTYNHTLSLVPSNAIEVSETEQSRSDSRLGKSQAVILEKKRRGDYLVYTERVSTYLIPSENLRINQFNIKTVEAVFECRGYQNNIYSDFKLLQPAIVYTITENETWQLQQRGILQF